MKDIDDQTRDFFTFALSIQRNVSFDVSLEKIRHKRIYLKNLILQLKFIGLPTPMYKKVCYGL